MKPWTEVTPVKADNRMFMLANPYGYIVNINHPDILPLESLFKRTNKIPVYAALDEEQRADFERYIISLFPLEFAQWHNDNDKKFKICGQVQKWIDKLGVLKNAKRR